MFRGIAAACLCGAAPLALSPAQAQGALQSEQLRLAKQAEKLKPGQWVWAEKIAPAGPILVYVDLGRQRATVYRNGVRIGVTTVSSGKDGYETPMGVFTILEKDKDHRSRTYDNAPMPYNLRLSWKGVALHAGNLPGYPASHGCVRLPMEFAQEIVRGDADGRHRGHRRRSQGSGQAPARRRAGAGDGRSDSGPDHGPDRDRQLHLELPKPAQAVPVSVIISTGDQQVVVLRNGIEIGRAKALVEQQTTESQVMTLTGGKKPRMDPGRRARPRRRAGRDHQHPEGRGDAAAAGVRRRHALGDDCRERRCWSPRPASAPARRGCRRRSSTPTTARPQPTE